MELWLMYLLPITFLSASSRPSFLLYPPCAELLFSSSGLQKVLMVYGEGVMS